MNFFDLLMGINTLGIVACVASSIIATSNLIFEISSSAAEEFVDIITSLFVIMSFIMLFSYLSISKYNLFTLLFCSSHFAIEFITSELTPRPPLL